MDRNIVFHVFLRTVEAYIHQLNQKQATKLFLKNVVLQILLINLNNHLFFKFLKKSLFLNKLELKIGFFIDFLMCWSPF
jgi:hypothetical protein